MLLLSLIMGLFVHAQDLSVTDKIYESEGQKFRFETLIQQKDVVWGFDLTS